MIKIFHKTEQDMKKEIDLMTYLIKSRNRTGKTRFVVEETIDSSTY